MPFVYFDYSQFSLTKVISADYVWISNHKMSKVHTNEITISSKYKKIISTNNNRCNIILNFVRQLVVCIWNLR